MNKLNTDHINGNAPYYVSYDSDGAIVFFTDYGVEYSITFDDDANPYYTAYWFNMSNMNHTPSPGDKKIAQTVICIIEEFFRQNPDILLYMCSTDDNQQAQRARLFLRWFNGAEQQKYYVIRSTEVEGVDEEGCPRLEYIAFIVQRSNPNLEDIIHLFDTEIAMFNEMK